MGADGGHRWTFNICRALLDDVLLITEQEILAGLKHAYLAENEILEGAAAVGIGALLAGRLASDHPVVVIMSGGNIDAAVHHQLVSQDTCQF